MTPQNPAAGAAAFLLRRLHAFLPFFILIFAILGLGMASRSKTSNRG